MIKKISFLCIITLILASCNTKPKSNAMKSEEVVSKLQEKLITAKEGDIIELPEGNFEFSKPLSLDKINKITFKGQGADKTKISFKTQSEGAEGFKISACNDLLLEGFTMTDCKGDIIKIQECNGLIVRNVTVGWTNGADSMNGSYALYPVTCSNVVIENCEVYCASDAGIYVGQSKNVIVRNNYVHENVAGIEIENTTNAEVYKNKCENNTGGICVFDLPDVPTKRGANVRVFDNDILNNNHPNFAPMGNSVAVVPAGTGSFILSTEGVEFFNNRITNHKTVGTAVISYLMLGRPLNDSLYDPFYHSISIHDNVYKNDTKSPDMTREMGQLVGKLFQNNGPEILIDGIFNPAMVDMKTGNLPEGKGVVIKNNGAIMIANLDAAGGFKNVKVDPALFSTGNVTVTTDPSWYKN